MLQPRHHRRRRQFRSLRRVVLVVLLAVVLLPAMPWLAVALFINADTMRSRIEDGASRATGRALSLGRVTMLRSLPPTIGAEDVTFANPPGASRRDMLRVPYLEASFGTLPLLFGRLEITSLLLSRPDLVLETDPAGTGNWRLAPRPADPLLGGDGISRRPRWVRRHAARARALVILEQLQVREGHLAWRAAAGDWIGFEVKRLNAAAPGMAAPGELTAQVVHADRSVNLALHTGRLDRLGDPAAIAPWPVRLELDVPGARASLAGTLSRPWELRGYDLAVEGAAEDLGDLRTLLHLPLPPLRQLVFQTRLADSGGTVPAISGISLRARQSDLDAWVPGLHLAAVDLAADSFDHPVHAALDGRFDGLPLHLVADLGAPAALLTPGRAPGRLPVSLVGEAAGGTLSVKGAIAAPEHGAGLDLEIAGTVPDLAALSPLLGIALPAWRNLTVGLHVGDAEGGFRQGLAGRNIQVHSAEADFAGEMDLRFAERTKVHAVLTGRRLDIDALLAAAGGMALPGPPAEAGPTGWLIPGGRLPFDRLTRTDVDLRATVADLRLGGTLFRDAALTAGLHDGELRLDPFTAVLPGGGIELVVALNARPRFPPVILSVRAAGLPVGPLLGDLGRPGDAAGTASLIANLRSAGASWRELAAGLTGQAGLAIAGADINSQLLETVLGPVLRSVGLSSPGAGLPASRIPVRCLALHVDARDGVAGLSGFVLDTPYLLLQAEGVLQLRDERLALRIRPTPRGGALPVAPVYVGGVFARTTIYPEQMPAVRAGGQPADVCVDAAAFARTAVPGH